MSGYPSATKSTGPGRLPPWLIFAFFLAVVAVSWWQTSHQEIPNPVDSRTTESNPADALPETPVITPGDGNSPIPAEVASDPEVRVIPNPGVPKRRQDPPESKSSTKQPSKTTENKAAATKASAAKIEHQTIRDQDGDVVFEGTIDLQPTLDRIRRGSKNSHRNDGTTFQNRERRLPAQPSGYYKEYVHPTPNTGGPGPQRVIIGKNGETWYTPDHYKTFKRIE